jgi:chromosome segregation ATPase
VPLDLQRTHTSNQLLDLLDQSVSCVQPRVRSFVRPAEARGDSALAEAKEASAKAEADLKARYEQDQFYLDFNNALEEGEAELRSQHERVLTEATNENSQKVAELTNIIEKEGEIDDVTAKYAEEMRMLEGRLSALEQERNELQQRSVDQERKTLEMQEESRQALNAALAEHEKDVEEIQGKVAEREKEVEELQGKVAAATEARQVSEKKQMISIATLKNDLNNAKQVSSSFWSSINSCR